jgi:HK97 family phage portal protein
VRTLRQLFTDVVAALRGEDPRNQMRFLLPYNVSGVYLTQDEALSLSAVWGCIDVITRNVASCKWCIYEPIPNTRRRRLLSDDYKTWMLNTRPNPEMTAIGFREAMLFQAIPFGNAYAEIVRDSGGRVVEMWPLMSDRMRPTRNEAWQLVYEYTNPNGTIQQFSQRQILHVRGPGLFGLMGDNLIARATKTIGLMAAQERFSSSYFGQGAQPTGVLEFPGRLAKDQLERLKESWNEKAKGPENAHKPIILESGMKFQSISVDPQKSQLVESRKFSVEDICRWFGVPPHKIQHLEHATFSNIEHSSIEFVRDALQPWERRVCQEADAKLFDQNRAPYRYTEIDLRPLTYGDAASRSTAQASWRQNGIMSANEIRAMEGLDDIGPDGDVYIVQSNMTTIDRILEPPEPPPGRFGPGAPSPADDDDENEDDSEMPVARRALNAAFQMMFNRYAKRLTNHQTTASGSPESRAQALEGFKTKQQTVMLEEFTPFQEMFASVFQKPLTLEDLARVMVAFEKTSQVEEAIKQLT